MGLGRFLLVFLLFKPLGLGDSDTPTFYLLLSETGSPVRRGWKTEDFRLYLEVRGRYDQAISVVIHYF